jgi:hypothetical protein
MNKFNSIPLLDLEHVIRLPGPLPVEAGTCMVSAYCAYNRGKSVDTLSHAHRIQLVTNQRRLLPRMSVLNLIEERPEAKA